MASDSVQDFVDRVKKDGIKIVRVDWLGLDLILRNMSTSIGFLEDTVRNGIGVTKAQQSFNVLDKLVSSGLYGAQSSEFKLIPRLETYATLPYLSGIGRVQAELCEPDTLEPTSTDPRYFLRRMLTLLDSMGYEAKVSFEPEFYLLSKEKNPVINGKLMSSHSLDLLNDFLQIASDALTRMNIEVEHFKKEYGGAQVEITTRYTEALRAADIMVEVKSVIKSLASARSMIASFMPKLWSSSSGNGMHIHLSLYNKGKGTNAFHDAKDKNGLELSNVAYSFIGGLMEHMDALCLFSNPLSNSYKRLVPGSWSPAHVCYGYDHRGAAIRIPSTSGAAKTSKRIEFRLPDCAANPYISLGSMLAAGIDGIRRASDPGPPVKYDPSSKSDGELNELGIRRLPTSLIQAIEAATRNSQLRSIIGDSLYDEYLKIRKSEWDDYYKVVDKWEVDNFLEPI